MGRRGHLLYTGTVTMHLLYTTHLRLPVHGSSERADERPGVSVAELFATH